MTSELPSEFVIAAPDDSMAPRVKAGKMLRLSRDIEPSPGDGVLIQDREGVFYFRQYRQKRPGAWAAVALNSAFQDLDSEADGLRVIAVLIAEEGRWSG